MMQKWIRIVEGAANLPHIFYHATSTTCLDNIKREGLLADPANRVYPEGHNSQALSGVYLATNFYSVLLHAKNAVDEFGGKPLIFIIGGDIAHTHMDEDHLKLFLQDFLMDKVDSDIHSPTNEVLQSLSDYYSEVFEQSPPKDELAAWFEHVLYHLSYGLPHLLADGNHFQIVSHHHAPSSRPVRQTCS
jgi:hypothetical protein